MNKKLILVLIIIVIILLGGISLGIIYSRLPRHNSTSTATTFEECVAAGNVVMESYPRQCRASGQTFVEFIGNELEKKDLIHINIPRPNQIISSPLTITGEARGNWFFEASFPVVLTDWDGRIIAQGIAQAKSDWMTTNFVPFEVTLPFKIGKNTYSNKGSLILKKDNPSGLSQNDDALEIPVIFAGVTDPFLTPDYKSTTYIIDGQSVILKNGLSEIASVPGSATRIITRYFGNEVRHDLNDDGREDIVFILTQETGGSGVYFYVVAALNTPTGYIGSQAYFLGDRIAPQTTEVDEGLTLNGTKRHNVIVVNYAVRLPDESFIVPPSIGKSVWLKLDPVTMQFGEVVRNFEGESR